MWHVRARGEVHTGFWCGNLMERYHLEDQSVDRIIFKWISNLRFGLPSDIFPLGFHADFQSVSG